MFAAFAALDEALDSAVNTLDVGGTFADLEKHIDADIGREDVLADLRGTGKLTYVQTQTMKSPF